MTIVSSSARRASLAAVLALATTACTSAPAPSTQGASSMPSTKPTATALDPELAFVTLINTFTVTPANQQAFVEVQHGEYRRLQGQIPGAIAANLHRGRSGTRVVNYAQFR